MSAHGVLVLDVDGAGARVQAQARVRWANGPAPLAAPGCEELRHRLTDLLDDLRSVADPAERLAVGARVLTAAGELALLHRRRWTGTGKWLVRRWAEACPRECAAVVEAVRVLAAEGDPAPLAAAAGAVLDAAGGPCTVGFRRVAPNAASHVSAGATIR